MNLGKMVENLIVLKFMEYGLSFEKMSLVLAGWRGSRAERETGKRPRTKGIKKKNISTDAK